MYRTVDSAIKVDSKQVSTQNDEYLIEQLIQQIQVGNESAAFEMRDFLARGVRWYLRRNAQEPSIEASTEQVLDATIQAIKDGKITNQASLTAFTRISVTTAAGKPSGTRVNPVVPDPVRVQSVKRALYELNELERDALVRYFEGQLTERICAELGISYENLSDLRSRLRKRCAELAARR